jgi:hypothetical protein
MHVEDKSKAFRQVVRKDQLARLHEMRSLPEQFQPVHQAYAHRPRLNKMRKNLELRSELTEINFKSDSRRKNLNWNQEGSDLLDVARPTLFISVHPTRKKKSFNLRTYTLFN